MCVASSECSGPTSLEPRGVVESLRCKDTSNMLQGIAVGGQEETSIRANQEGPSSPDYSGSEPVPDQVLRLLGGDAAGGCCAGGAVSTPPTDRPDVEEDKGLVDILCGSIVEPVLAEGAMGLPVGDGRDVLWHWLSLAQ